MSISADGSRRFRLRFSLLTALLSMTIVGMAIVIVQMWIEVGPLRAQVRSMRSELGLLNIDDPTQAQAIQIATGEAYHWKWRIYLPPGGTYRELCYSGMLPSPKEYRGQAWFDRVENGGIGSGTSGTMDGGEFTLDVKLEKDGDHWVLIASESGGRGGSKDSIVEPSGEWLSVSRNLSASSAVSSREQTGFGPGQPIMLLMGVKSILTEFPGGYSKVVPDGDAEGFVMWIEQQPPQSATLQQVNP